MALTGSSARRYAEAIYDLASTENAVSAYAVSLDQLRRALTAEILRVLRDPRVPMRQRREALDKATADQPRTVRSLLDLLLERDRIELLPRIAAEFVAIIDRRAGIVDGKITTTAELGAAERDDLVKRLERATGRRVRAAFAVDPSLIGGAKVQIGDRLIDTSLKAQLVELQRELAS